MSLWMEGSLSTEDQEKIKGYKVYYHPREGTDPEGVLYEGAWSGVYEAIFLWKLLGSEKGDELERLVKEEIEIDETMDENEQHTIVVSQIKQILDLLDGLDSAILKLTDKGGYVKPEAVSYVLEKYPYAMSRLDAEGKYAYSLDEEIRKVEGLKWFLEHALRLNRVLKIG